MGCNKNEIFQCSHSEDKCNVLIEVLQGCTNDCTLMCGKEPMVKVVLKSADQGLEKHVPVIEKIEGGFKVKIGEVPHPMEADHFIQFIEIRTEDEVQRKYLKPGMAPEAIFKIAADKVQAIEFCNKHGMWGV